MKILFVLNNFFTTGNGLAASARRTVEYLRKAGHEVRIMSGPNHKDPSVKPDYPLEDYKFPIVQPIIRAQGYVFAQSNLPLMEEAARWADVIHLEEPFVIEDRMIKICERLGKPVTGTYHLHPEIQSLRLCTVPYGKCPGPPAPLSYQSPVRGNLQRPCSGSVHPPGNPSGKL